MPIFPWRPNQFQSAEANGHFAASSPGEARTQKAVRKQVIRLTPNLIIEHFNPFLPGFFEGLGPGRREVNFTVVYVQIKITYGVALRVLKAPAP